jgi:hypothetical protein
MIAIMAATTRPTAVYLEVGEKKAFACSIDWPGWCRPGRDADSALAALADYAPRYALVAENASRQFPAGTGDRLAVVERVKGSVTTDFGAPGAVPQVDSEALSAAAARRMTGLVVAAWAVLDEVAAGAPATLRKGPRGGGRDRDAMVAHVLTAEAAYARKIGVRHSDPPLGDERAIARLRGEISATLRSARSGEPHAERGWPPRYAARRIAWHVLDHAWEIEDRSAT